MKYGQAVINTLANIYIYSFDNFKNIFLYLMKTWNHDIS